MMEGERAFGLESTPPDRSRTPSRLQEREPLPSTLEACSDNRTARWLAADDPS